MANAIPVVLKPMAQASFRSELYAQLTGDQVPFVIVFKFSVQVFQRQGRVVEQGVGCGGAILPLGLKSGQVVAALVANGHLQAVDRDKSELEIPCLGLEGFALIEAYSCGPCRLCARQCSSLISTAR